MASSAPTAHGDRLLVCNLANGDMVGHTGFLAATVDACAVLDESIGEIASATLAMDGTSLF